jgi:hypothetical protein
MSSRNITSSATLAPNVAQQITGANSNRLELTIQNTGTGNVTIGFGSAPTGAGMGLSLDGASTAGGQGGTRLWGLSTKPHTLPDEWVPGNSIWALSAAGSTVVVVESLP